MTTSLTFKSHYKYPATFSPPPLDFLTLAPLAPYLEILHDDRLGDLDRRLNHFACVDLQPSLVRLGSITLTPRLELGSTPLLRLDFTYRFASRDDSQQLAH